MRIWFSILGAGVLLAAGGMVVSATKAQTAKAPAAQPPATAGSAHDFTLTRIDGKPLPLDAYKGKVVLLVNTASFCGFTSQYEGLQKLQQSYAAKGFTVIGVPSGDFMSQEYDDNGKIKEFCETKFGITFPMAEKAHVKGANAIPLYRWAKTQLPTENEPKWNFHKFLIGKDGKLIAGYNSKVTPDSAALTAAIEKALKA
ncbi:glutathione peroxidase [Sandaracinobacter sp. RS1-74]|uniref:glutathione peroxidase n=1 Tax=Sandaracinobacteroides sayramensis TaxID=2913411 RepID=UPI001EDA537A|nr:glutathione peroxidase [Sandaracinobacteroides sayramensis]MCG2841684.1 glutathione peroxidase [Sandaracinobacteroides sayramensis]